MPTTPSLTSSELLSSILIVPQCVTTDLSDFTRTIMLTRYKTLSALLPEVRSLIVLYRKKEVLHTVESRLRPATTELSPTIVEAWDFVHNSFW